MFKLLVYLIFTVIVASVTLSFVQAQEEGVEGEEPSVPIVAEIGVDGIQRATILLDSYSYTPEHLVVQLGQPVELTLKSETFLIPHNFLLTVPEAGMDINEEVGSGDEATIHFTPTQAGSYAFYCDKQLLFFPSHREEGMEGRLEVRE